MKTFFKAKIKLKQKLVKRMITENGLKFSFQCGWQGKQNPTNQYCRTQIKENIVHKTNESKPYV